MIIIVLLIVIALVGYVFLMYKKNETFNIPETCDINEKPIMPHGINTHVLVTKEKELKSAHFIKLKDFSIDDLPYINYHIGFFNKEKNVYAIISQDIPNPIQKFLGVYDLPYITVMSVFDNGSDLRTTTKKGIEKEVYSKYRKVEYHEENLINFIVDKHIQRVDFVETTGVMEITLNEDDFIKHIKRGLKIDIINRVTKGYETKTDIEKILDNLKLKLKEENKEGSTQ